ncbi:response regulator transcription factor [Shouchella clausii]|uniref:response regulator transcription factor n=2 Tax=Bacillaceae TaxID=186817 RepID=UPI00203B1BC9|nr:MULTISPECIES: LuxR C-terminal-related transcriptional regulator [Shouchella]MCM3380934.1 LuxR C-terminal-related transcriptional regulator [Shouchella rhizosphaerae]
MRLSRTERSIIYLISEETPNKIIAQKLNLSQRMVEYHISNLIKKMKVESRVGIIVKSFRTNILK